jgi:DNA invertase Pin-like site-specific DNA recombinase
MSSNQQRYSVENQKALIAVYALAHGYEIVRTYADTGRSGLSLKGRAALRQLLADVLDPARGFDAVLVLDVTRWGRFQDTDQAAHYEFLCRQEKVPIIYCQESFEDDMSPTSSILKLLKRVMAAEFSRELSQKVSRAKLRLAALGYNMGGGVSYGFRRELRDERGKRRLLLEAGETKAAQTDRVVFVPGPPEEIVVINRIFDMFGNHGMSFAAIARALEVDGILAGDARWTASRVRTVLKSELCIGTSTYNRSVRTLQSRSRPNPEAVWVRARIMEPAVPVELFQRVRARLSAARPFRHSEEFLLERLRLLLDDNGRLSEGLVQKSSLTPSTSTYQYHFGSLQNAYKLIGYDQPQWVRDRYRRRPPTDEELIARLRTLHTRVGYVTGRTIDEDPDLPSWKFVRHHFGTLARALAVAGLPTATHSQKMLFKSYEVRMRRVQTPAPAAASGGAATTHQEFIAGLKRLLNKHNYLSSELIQKDEALPTPAVIITTFGSLLNAYELAGWKRTRLEIMTETAIRRSARRRALIAAEMEG